MWRLCAATRGGPVDGRDADASVAAAGRADAETHRGRDATRARCDESPRPVDGIRAMRGPLASRSWARRSTQRAAPSSLSLVVIPVVMLLSLFLFLFAVMSGPRC